MERRKRVLAVRDDELDVRLRHDATTARRRRLPGEGHVRECQETHTPGDPAGRVRVTGTSGDRENKNVT